MHWDIVNFLKQRKLHNGGYDNPDGLYDDELEHYLCVQVRRGQLFVGESYSNVIYNRMDLLKKYKRVVKKLGIDLKLMSGRHI